MSKADPTSARTKHQGLRAQRGQLKPLPDCTRSWAVQFHEAVLFAPAGEPGMVASGSSPAGRYVAPVRKHTDHVVPDLKSVLALDTI